MHSLLCSTPIEPWSYVSGNAGNEMWKHTHCPEKLEHESIRFTHLRIQNQEYHLNMMDTPQGLFRCMAGRGFFEFF
jgi:hypothetical protein